MSRRRPTPRGPCPVEPLEPRQLLATLTWVGDLDAKWGTVKANTSPPFGINTNWSSDALPSTGDTLVFPAGAPAASTNDLSGASVAAIQITGVGAGSQRYTIGGNTVTLTGGATAMNVTAAPDTAGLGPRLTLSIQINNSATFAVSNAGTTVELTGVLSGAGALTKTGAGTLLLTNPGNSFGNPLALQTVAAGVLQLGANKAFPDGRALTVNAGATFDLNNVNVQVANLKQGGGTVDLGSASLTIGTPSGLQGGNAGVAITGAGGSVVVDYGAAQGFAGAAANTYTGATTVKNGSLGLAKPSGVLSIPGDLVIGSAAPAAGAAATVGLDGEAGSDEQIADAANVTINPNGELFLGSRFETIGSLSGQAGAALHLGFGTLRITGSRDTTFAGTLDDASPGKAGTNGGNALIKSGLGVLTLTADNPFTATIALVGGALYVNGAQAASPVVITGGTLGGAGSLGSVSAGAISGGAIAPGAAPNTTAVLRTKNLTLNARSRIALYLNGLDPGADNDQLNVQGALALNGAALDVRIAAGFTPGLGTSFVLINNDGADPVAGTFAGLPESAHVVFNGLTYRLTYTGGTGNDVVLIREDGPAVLSAAYDPATAPRLRFVFTQNVRQTLGVADLLIRNLDTGQTTDPATFTQTYDDATNTATFTHAGGPLTDGNYCVTLDGAGVANTAAQAIGTAITTLDFFAFAGDANRDRTVDFNDLVKLAQNYNTPANTFPQGDFNYDGKVDFGDLVLLAQRYNTTLPLPPIVGVESAPSLPQPATALPKRSSVLADDRTAKPVFSVVPVRRPAAPKPRAIPKR